MEFTHAFIPAFSTIVIWCYNCNQCVNTIWDMVCIFFVNNIVLIRAFWAEAMLTKKLFLSSVPLRSFSFFSLFQLLFNSLDAAPTHSHRWRRWSTFSKFNSKSLLTWMAEWHCLNFVWFNFFFFLIFNQLHWFKFLFADRLNFGNVCNDHKIPDLKILIKNENKFDRVRNCNFFHHTYAYIFI